MRAKSVLFRLVRLVFGLFIVSVSIVLQLNARLGFSPWTVLDNGVQRQLGFTIGLAGMLISAIIIAIDLAAKEKIGIGTLSNMVLIGVFTDMLNAWGILPIASGLWDGLLFLFFSIVTLCIGVWLYVGAGFGAGPRDSLMMAAMKYTGKPLGLCRSALEVGALIAGYLLGGSVGAGTVLQSVATGFVMQYIFRLVDFRAKEVRHEYLDDLLKVLTNQKQARQTP